MRRGSASAGGHASANSSATRVHRSNGSNNSISGGSPNPSQQGLPYSSPPGNASTPQQKVVYALVGRLKNKLPCNSGITLPELEMDDAIQQTIESLVDLSRDSLDIIAWALSELLEKLAKQTDSNGYRTLDILQSQLFLLKVLSIAMASRWTRRPDDMRPSSGATVRRPPGPGSITSITDALPSSAKPRKGRLPSAEQYTLSPWVEPPAIDDICAKYILSVMVLLIRQTAPPQQRLMSSANLNFSATFHDFESVEVTDSPLAVVNGRIADPPPITKAAAKTIIRAKHASNNSLNSTIRSTVSSSQYPQHSTTYEKTSTVTSKSSSSLNAIVSKFAGRIVYHLSASNWQVVFSRIKLRIRKLADATEEDPDIVDLLLLTHSALNRVRLVQALQELSSLLVNMKKEAQAAIAIPLRTAVWNWIDLFSDEFNEALRYHRRMEGAPERVFDLLYELSETDSRVVVWPTLTALICISSDRIHSDFNVNSAGYSKVLYGRKDRNFPDLIVRMMGTPSKHSEVALICALDICRAASRVRPEPGREMNLQLLANDIAHEVKSYIHKWDGQRPFWDNPDEIDVALVGDALVTLFRFVSQEEALEVFSTCLEPERSEAVKICAIKACITLVVEAARLPWQPSLDKLMKTSSKRLYNILKSCLTRRCELDQNGNMKKSSLRPKAKRYTSETLPDRELLALAVLTLWRADVNWIFATMDVVDHEQWSIDVADIWGASVDPAVKLSMSQAFRQAGESVNRMTHDHPHFEVGLLWMRCTAPATLLVVSINLLEARTSFEAQRMWINVAYEMMHRFTFSPDEIIGSIMLNPDDEPAFILAEIAFLVTLTSADINVSLTAAHCLRLIATRERQIDIQTSHSLPQDERLKRHPTYEQLGDPKVVVIGRVGHQKRIRKLMRHIAFPSAVHVAVWEECYWRWCAMNEMAIKLTIDATADGFDSGTAPIGGQALTMEERQAQWQNLTLFLAAFGAACTGDNHDTLALTQVLEPRYLPDQMRVLRDPKDLMGTFITELVGILVADEVVPREVARDALSIDLSPRLYMKIFKELDIIIQAVADGHVNDWAHLAIFLEQVMTILKTLVENAQNVEEMRGIDISAILISLATFTAKFSGMEAYRLRTKYCVLCDAVFERADTISMRKDSNTRQGIADIVTEWMQDPNQTSDPELVRPRRELNIIALRTAVKLFDRLQLEAPEGQSSEDSSHAVSRIFIRYSSFILRTWEFSSTDGPFDDAGSEKSYSHVRASQQDGELRELIIAGLSSLIIANTEFGVKHLLPLAYETSPLKRTIFAHVFARVLGQGIQFTTQEIPAVVSRQSRLCELVKGPDMALALAICEICPPSEVDSLISVLLNIFDTRSSLINLLKTMIDREISRTESDTALFRSNSTCTRFLSAFAKIYGYNYLRSLILPLMQLMTTKPNGHGYDLDPTKVPEHELKQNQANVEVVAKSFLDIISSSVPTFPSMFREICAHIAKAVNEVWPEAKFAALGAFIFLRFISPAVVAPETVDIELPKDNPVIRRGLMVIAKIIQNLANNIFFGKEAHMVVLNEFLQENIVNVTRFLSEINKFTPTGPEDDPEEWLDTTYDDTDTIVLHRFFEKHIDKVGKELLSVSKHPTEKLSAEAEAALAVGKRSWEAVCGALIEMGQPLDSPKLSPFNSDEHVEYKDLLAKYARRDTAPVRNLFVQAETPQDQVAIFVLSVAKIDVEVLDVELLLFYIFKLLALPINQSRRFDVVFDFTGFNAGSQIPAQWLRFAHEVIPSDIRARFSTSHILTPNATAVKYLRRLYNLASGVRLSANCIPHSSVRELLEHYWQDVRMSSLEYAVGMENEPTETFQDVTIRHIHPMRVPVVLEVAKSHLRISTVKAQPICSSVSCKATEIIPLKDISDVYNVSTGHDSYEFIVRKLRQGVTLYFSSSQRDTIVKAIRSAKGNMQNVQLPGAERWSRLSNVAATLLHVGMMTVGAEDEGSRNAAYELLTAICTHLGFEGKPIVPSKAIYLPGHQGHFVLQLSDRLASFAPELTLDFLSEVAAGWDKSTIAQRTTCLQYMSPWIRNLARFADPTSPLYEHSGSKFRDCVRVLVDLTLAEQEIYIVVQKYIWIEVSKLDSSVVNVILDELMRAAVDGGSGSQRCEIVADTMAALSSINVRGRILSRIRKVLGKTSMKPTKSLADNVHWNEIACLTRLAVVAAYHCKNVVQSQLYVPETIHLVTLIAATGQISVRSSMYGIVVNLLQAIYLAKMGDTSAGPDIRTLLDEFSQPEILRLFGLCRLTTTSDYSIIDPSTDKVYLDNLESLTRLLVRVLEAVAGSKGLLNVWRARWMSLITSSAFQLSPAIQTRAFVSLGILATSDVDDDLLYQMLVAFKTALSQSTETDTTSVVSMLRCICKIVPSLPRSSRYLSQLFWLAVALLQSSHIGLYVEAINLLRVTLEVMAAQGAFKDKGVAPTLLEGRAPLEEIACQLDQLLGLSFESNFSFSLASTIFKGVRYAKLRDSATLTLRSLLRITVQTCVDIEHSDDDPGAPVCDEALGYFLALLPSSTSVKCLRRLIEDSNVHTSWLLQDFGTSGAEDEPITKIPFELIGIVDRDTALFVISFVSAMLATAQVDHTETELLFNLLSDIANAYPEIVTLAYDSLQDKIKDTFANSSNPAILSAVSNIFRVAMQDTSQLSVPRGSATTLSTVDEGSVHGPGRGHLYALEEVGMHGLANSFQFLPPNRGHATKMINWISELVMRIIE